MPGTALRRPILKPNEFDRLYYISTTIDYITIYFNITSASKWALLGARGARFVCNCSCGRLSLEHSSKPLSPSRLCIFSYAFNAAANVSTVSMGRCQQWRMVRYPRLRCEISLVWGLNRAELSFSDRSVGVCSGLIQVL